MCASSMCPLASIWSTHLSLGGCTRSEFVLTQLPLVRPCLCLLGGPAGTINLSELRIRLAVLKAFRDTVVGAVCMHMCLACVAYE